MRCYWILVFVLSLMLVAADAPDRPVDAEAKEHLAKVQQLVGQWRGVGQPQRGSTKGSWTEEADWGWSFADGVRLVGKLPQGKWFRTLELSSHDQEYFLTGTPTLMGEKMVYVGAKDESGRMIFTPKAAREGFPKRITLRFAAEGDRLLILYESQNAATSQFARLAEVGYTRKGSQFGKGAAKPECVVTGGLGTIEVTYAGQTYFVCCTGCRDYFNENPEEVLAEYKARKEAERAKPE